MTKSKQPEYKAWKSMKSRCYALCNANAGNYQSKGIVVCDRWINSYENFLEDMGKKPTPKHSLDRIDNDGNYEPANCRWLLIGEQSRNRGDFHETVTYNGETKILKDWARYFGIKYTTLYMRIKRGGLSFEDAIQKDPYKRQIEHNGESKTLKEWSNQYNLNYQLIVCRISRGGTPKDELLKEIKNIEEAA
jgi:hypothetical protein